MKISFLRGPGTDHSNIIACNLIWLRMTTIKNTNSKYIWILKTAVKTLERPVTSYKDGMKFDGPHVKCLCLIGSCSGCLTNELAQASQESKGSCFHSIYFSIHQCTCSHKSWPWYWGRLSSQSETQSNARFARNSLLRHLRSTAALCSALKRVGENINLNSTVRKQWSACDGLTTASNCIMRGITNVVPWGIVSNVSRWPCLPPLRPKVLWHESYHTISPPLMWAFSKIEGASSYEIEETLTAKSWESRDSDIQ